jgi:hypothetical protein
MTVINLDAMRAGHAIAEQFEKQFGSEIKQARAAGVRLQYRFETLEQIGRGEIYVAHVQIIPVADGVKRKFKRMGQIAIQAKAEYEDPPNAMDALKAALDEAWTLGRDAGVF